MDEDVVLGEVAVHEAALLVQAPDQEHHLRVHALQQLQPHPRILARPTSILFNFFIKYILILPLCFVVIS